MSGLRLGAVDVPRGDHAGHALGARLHYALDCWAFAALEAPQVVCTCRPQYARVDHVQAADVACANAHTMNKKQTL